LPPEGLYRDGLNRQLFLPFIGRLRDILDVVSLDSPHDYRVGRLKAHETFIHPDDEAAGKVFDALWDQLTDASPGEPETIDVLGRKLHVPHAAHGCARFTFNALCRSPLGPADYLALAHNYRTVFVAHIPKLSAAERNEARRFILMIDTFYDAGIRLVATAATPPEGIYPRGDHRVEFARTISRLKEMQAASWWGQSIAET
jgi:cell division protein ZapE